MLLSLCLDSQVHIGACRRAQSKNPFATIDDFSLTLVEDPIQRDSWRGRASNEPESLMVKFEDAFRR